MATRTTTLQLYKPDLTDPISPTMFNQNSDIIDSWVTNLGTPARIAKGSYVGTGATKSLYSSTAEATQNIRGMAYGSGKIVTGYYYSTTNHGVLVSSDNGATWTTVNFNSLIGSASYPVEFVAYENGAFYAVINYASSGSTYKVRILRSTDATTWSDVYIDSSFMSSGNGPTNFIYGSGVYLITCTTRVLYSTDGTSWQVYTPSISGVSNASFTNINITYGNSLFVGRVYDSAHTKYYTMRSSNGTTWTLTEDLAVNGVVFYKDETFYLVDFSNKKVYSSVSGLSWTILSDIFVGTQSNIANFNSMIRYVNGTIFWGNVFSNDLIYWDTIPRGSNVYYIDARCVIYNGTNYMFSDYDRDDIYIRSTSFVADDKTINLSFTPKVLLLQSKSSNDDTYSSVSVLIGDKNMLYINSNKVFTTVSSNSFALRQASGYSTHNGGICFDAANTKYTYVAIG